MNKKSHAASLAISAILFVAFFSAYHQRYRAIAGNEIAYLQSWCSNCDGP